MNPQPSHIERVLNCKNPTGVRFNGEKTAFVMQKEGLTTPQQVLNFLLGQYWLSNQKTAKIAQKQPTKTFVDRAAGIRALKNKK